MEIKLDQSHWKMMAFLSDMEGKSFLASDCALGACITPRTTSAVLKDLVGIGAVRRIYGVDRVRGRQVRWCRFQSNIGHKPFWKFYMDYVYQKRIDRQPSRNQLLLRMMEAVRKGWISLEQLAKSRDFIELNPTEKEIDWFSEPEKLRTLLSQQRKEPL